MNTTRTNENFNNITTTTTPTTTTTTTQDNIISKINGENKRRIEPEFKKILSLFKNKTFTQIYNFSIKNYELTFVENEKSSDNFKIISLPKYKYSNSLKTHLLIELPEIELTKYPMPSKKYLQTYGGSFNSLNYVINKKDKNHAEIFKNFQYIDDYNKINCIGIAKKEQIKLVKPYRHNIDDKESQDNYCIKMSFYVDNMSKALLSKITKSHEENPNVVEDVSVKTLEELSYLLNNNNAKATIVCSLPYVWTMKKKSNSDASNVSDTNNTNNTSNTNNISNTNDTNNKKSIWGIKVKIIAMHIFFPKSENKLGFGKQRNVTVRNSNYYAADKSNNNSTARTNNINDDKQNNKKITLFEIGIIAALTSILLIIVTFTTVTLLLNFV